MKNIQREKHYMGHLTKFTRRSIIAGVAAIGLAFSAGAALAQTIKVAGIFTLPVEQQWISRIHIALKAAEARGDIEYVYTLLTPKPESSDVR
jgi:basic membrane protein A and related proteins